MEFAVTKNESSQFIVQCFDHNDNLQIVIVCHSFEEACAIAQACSNRDDMCLTYENLGWDNREEAITYRVIRTYSRKRNMLRNKAIAMYFHCKTQISHANLDVLI